mgnify:FL=1
MQGVFQFRHEMFAFQDITNIWEISKGMQFVIETYNHPELNI